MVCCMLNAWINLSSIDQEWAHEAAHAKAVIPHIKGALPNIKGVFLRDPLDANYSKVASFCSEHEAQCLKRVIHYSGCSSESYLGHAEKHLSS